MRTRERVGEKERNAGGGGTRKCAVRGSECEKKVRERDGTKKCNVFRIDTLGNGVEEDIPKVLLID